MNAKEYLEKTDLRFIDNTLSMDEAIAVIMEKYHQHRLSEVTEGLEELFPNDNNCINKKDFNREQLMRRVGAKYVLNLLKQQ